MSGIDPLTPNQNQTIHRDILGAHVNNYIFATCRARCNKMFRTSVTDIAGMKLLFYVVE